MVSAVNRLRIFQFSTSEKTSRGKRESSDFSSLWSQGFGFLLNLKYNCN
jgi:hypothetical protein